MSIIRTLLALFLERAFHFKHCVILLNIYHLISLLRDAETSFVLNPDFKLLYYFFSNIPIIDIYVYIQFCKRQMKKCLNYEHTTEIQCKFITNLP